MATLGTQNPNELRTRGYLSPHPPYAFTSLCLNNVANLPFLFYWITVWVMGRIKSTVNCRQLTYLYFLEAKNISYETCSALSHSTLTRDASHMHKTVCVCGGGGTRTTKTMSWKNHTFKLLTNLMPRFCNVRMWEYRPAGWRHHPSQTAAKYLTVNYAWDYEITRKEVLVTHSKQLVQTEPNDQKAWPLIRYVRQIQPAEIFSSLILSNCTNRSLLSANWKVCTVRSELMHAIRMKDPNL